MKYQITYSCGHTGEVRLFGKTSERERKLKWLGSILCKECAFKADKETAEREGYPEITSGSTEKGIMWAYEIRNQKIPELKEFAQKVKIRPEEKELFDRIFNKIINNTSAGFWIEYKDFDPLGLIREIWKKENNSKNKST